MSGNASTFICYRKSFSLFFKSWNDNKYELKLSLNWHKWINTFIFNVVDDERKFNKHTKIELHKNNHEEKSN